MKKYSRAKIPSFFSTGDPTLLAYYEWDTQTGDVQDLSGKGEDATITGSAVVIDDAIGVNATFDGASNYATISSPLTDLAEITANGGMAISSWFKLDANVTDRVLVAQKDGGGTGQSWIVVNDSGVSNEISTYLGGSVLRSTISAGIGQWVNVVVNYLDGELQVWVNGTIGGNSARDVRSIDDGADGDIVFTIDKAGANSFNGAINQTLIFDRGLLQEEIEAIANKGVVQFVGGYGATDTTSKTAGFLGDTPLLVDSGTYKVATEKIGNELVKVIENEVAGVAYLPLSSVGVRDTEAAYGTWEFWLYKENTANVSDILLFCDTIGGAAAVGQDGYGIRFSNTESVDLFESTNGTPATLFSSDTGFIANQTWYGIKLTRTPDGEFEASIRGGSFGNDYIPILILGAGTGSNPVTDTTTTSGQHLVLDLDAGDKFAYGSKGARYSFTKNLFKK
jgi:hypothetical protein